MDEELVWVANRNTPILDESGRLTRYTSSGDETWNQLPNWAQMVSPILISDKSPAQGSFMLGLDQNVTNQLILWWRGEVYQTSKLWLVDLFNSSNSWTRGKYEFSFTSNEQEIYFSYSLTSEQTSKLLEILTDARLSIPELGFGMARKVPTEAKFTEAKWDDINSRNEVMEVVDYCSRSSTFDLVVFLVLRYLEKVEGKRREVVVAINHCIGVVLLVLLLCYLCYLILRKLKAKSATDNFSATNKLGEGGSGPVYKAWQQGNEGRGLELMDQTMDESFSPNEVLRCLHVGLLCVQDQAADRPIMLEVVSLLTNETVALPAPKQPALFINITSEEPEVPENKLQNYSANNGQQLRDRDQLVSAFGKFSLKFFSPKDVEKRYLGILNRRGEPAWVANRNIPILDESGSLTIDSSDGNLKIFQRGGDPISISWVQGVRNTRATLLKSGNLVLHEVNSNGSTRRLLWQSFDYPTDTLLPGMKLGINLRTGHKWFLQSWITEDSPAQGSFTLGMDLNITNKLVIWWRGEVYWMGELSRNEQSMSSNSWTIANFEFRLVANEQEKYLTFSSTRYPDDMLKIQPNVSSQIQALVSMGLVSSEKVYQKDPICRKDTPFFESRYGFMSRDGFKFKESENMSYIDCELKCWNNCSCAAYRTTHRGIGCEIWGREANFTESDREFVNSRHIRILQPKKNYLVAKNKRWSPLKIAVGTAFLVSLLCYLIYFIWRKVKPKVLSKRKRKKLLRILRQSFLLITSYGKEKREDKGHGINRELKIFDFQVISAATDNFSTDYKLGEGGFGPVYKKSGGGYG
ncbi:hypothetical protein Pint_29837 [Pistacia integerrima]|uniref:Uncharacterized protein n=1 Tax=Pistacia integerrima TaxID=434235 RepID=A0ACC0X3B3_9ROSI|nr:hypothetical protein Pint_29837 [Pistacia integerrima]